MTGPDVVTGYVRVSTDEQGERGLGLDAQEATIRYACQRRGWTLLEPIRVDVASGKSRAHRPQLAAALEDVETGRAGTLMVAKLDRLSRSLYDFAAIMADANAKGWNLVAEDLNIDLSTPNGKLMANIMAVLAEWERETIANRTREALGVLKRRGVELGRPKSVPETVRARILTGREQGLSYAAIAADLNARGVPTGQGGKQWYGGTVRAVEKREAAR